MPIRNYVSQIFARSPITGIEQHMSQVHECAQLLPGFIDAACQGDFNKAADIHKKIEEFEHAADDIKRNLRMSLPKTVFMPVARADLLDLITAQDRIANRVKDISGLILGRKLSIPSDVHDDFKEFSQRAVDTTNQANKTVGELSELFESGFRGAEVDIMEGMIEQLDAIESDTDQMEVQIREHLYSVEDQYAPIDMMFLYKIIDEIGELANLAESVGSRLQQILAR
ncbi:MAG: TIGR00153 family protein [Salinisphaeraceae bacterium]|nr:TIGR00153 family protein [Salinisphaeraceae bacterium]